MKKCYFILLAMIFMQVNCYAFTPQNACKYMTSVSGLSTNGYKSDGMGEYFCASNYKLLDGKTNIAYYAEGSGNNAKKVYLVLNLYNTSNKAAMMSNFVSSAKILSKNSINYTLDNVIITAMQSGKSGSWKLGKYTIEVKKQNFSTGLGSEIHFIIKE